MVLLVLCRYRHQHHKELCVGARCVGPKGWLHLWYQDHGKTCRHEIHPQEKRGQYISVCAPNDVSGLPCMNVIYRICVSTDTNWVWTIASQDDWTAVSANHHGNSCGML